MEGVWRLDKLFIYISFCLAKIVGKMVTEGSYKYCIIWHRCVFGDNVMELEVTRSHV